MWREALAIVVSASSLLAAACANAELVAEAARTLLDLARVQEGDLPPDPGAFARRVTGLLARGIGGSPHSDKMQDQAGAEP